ncbi:UNVERIFIED_CONTAM: hypothetical protein PYX00_001076 [Menopon gallinae]|uniref:Phospholipase B1, membrane-associated n=1 Tax=Menopon gallinae TaxID=328185 RepID=A0AAW2ICT7_9NEOP
MDYPCPDRSLWKSAVPPESVHKLRPGDINVVAAIGDSLTAANGARTDNLYEVIFRENRGVSWSIGGQGNWSQFLTVPNLLKVMNPELVGYSIGDGSPFSKAAQFNAAYFGAMDQDIMGQAVWLVRKLKTDPRVDFRNDWKMLTLMIGTNDVCSDQCYSKRQGVETHRRNIIRVLDFLYLQLPKTFVNLVSMPYIPAYADLVDPPFPTCITMKLLACSCLFGGAKPGYKLSNVMNMTRAFQAVQKEIAESGRYDRREDFTVVFQPTNLNSRFPKLKKSRRWNSPDPHDYSYISIDCIHYTQKLHAISKKIFRLYQSHCL